jgi:hypothetical protein
MQLLMDLNFFVLFTGRARLYKRLERQPGQNQGSIDFCGTPHRMFLDKIFLKTGTPARYTRRLRQAQTV